MPDTVKNRRRHPGDLSIEHVCERTVDMFSRLVSERMLSLARGIDHPKIMALTEKALREAKALMSFDVAQLHRTLPVSKLKASDVIAQRLVDLSQATLYRKVENEHFYCTTPKGRSIGKTFPSWQFVEPVPELLGSVLRILGKLPSSEIDAFWVSASDELNDLSPAEVLAGIPFETRGEVLQSQIHLLAQPTNFRLRKVQLMAQQEAEGVAKIIG